MSLFCPFSLPHSVVWCWCWGWSCRVRRVPSPWGFCRGFWLLLPSPCAISRGPGRVLLWGDWGSIWREQGLCDVCVPLGVALRAGTGCQRCALCLLSVVRSSWSTCPAGCLRNERSLVGEVCPLSEKSCVWDAALADMGLGLGTPTLHHDNSSALPSALLKSFPRLAQKQQWIFFFFLLLGMSIFQEKAFSQCPSSSFFTCYSFLEAQRL